MVKKKTFNPGPPPYNSLNKIKGYLKDGKYIIDEKARNSADNDFGWGKADIVRALKALKPHHFHKKAKLWENPKIIVDYYKARDHFDENVYTHFHIDPDEDKLIVNSFKEV